MSSFKVAKSGTNVLTAGVKDLLIDSDYPTMLYYSSSSSSQLVPAAGGTNVSFPLPSTWLPYGFFLTDHDGTHTTAGKYYFQKNNAGIGFISSGWTPQYNAGTGQYSGWQYIWNSTGTSFTANYISYISYLQSDGAYNNTTTLSPSGSYMSVAISGVNVQTATVRQLAFTTLVPTTQIVQENVAVMTQTGNGATCSSSFSHGLGKVLPFIGFITQSTMWSSNQVNFSTATLLKTTNNESFSFAMDTSNFYLDIDNSVNTTAYSTTVHVYFLQLPA